MKLLLLCKKHCSFSPIKLIAVFAVLIAYFVFLVSNEMPKDYFVFFTVVCLTCVMFAMVKTPFWFDITIFSVIFFIGGYLSGDAENYPRLAAFFGEYFITEIISYFIALFIISWVMDKSTFSHQYLYILSLQICLLAICFGIQPETQNKVAEKLMQIIEHPDILAVFVTIIFTFAISTWVFNYSDYNYAVIISMTLILIFGLYVYFNAALISGDYTLLFRTTVIFTILLSASNLGKAVVNLRKLINKKA